MIEPIPNWVKFLDQDSTADIRVMGWGGRVYLDIGEGWEDVIRQHRLAIKTAKDGNKLVRLYWFQFICVKKQYGQAKRMLRELKEIIRKDFPMLVGPRQVRLSIAVVKKAGCFVGPPDIDLRDLESRSSSN